MGERRRGGGEEEEDEEEDEDEERGDEGEGVTGSGWRSRCNASSRSKYRLST